VSGCAVETADAGCTLSVSSLSAVVRSAVLVVDCYALAPIVPLSCAIVLMRAVVP
jgi:hypothetical protein